MVTTEDLFNCPGWQAINRIGAFSNMHNIFQQNHSELMELLIRIQNDVQLSKDTIQLIWVHLEQRVFNYLSSAYALEEHARKMMAFYEEKKIYLDYKKTIKSYFEHDSLSQFIKWLRNHQIHCRITPMIFTHTGESVNIVFLSEELLKANKDRKWNVDAEKYIKNSGTEINLIKTIFEYTNKINSFYMWLYRELSKYHIKDLQEKDKIAKSLGMDIKKWKIILEIRFHRCIFLLS